MGCKNTRLFSQSWIDKYVLLEGTPFDALCKVLSMPEKNQDFMSILSLYMHFLSPVYIVAWFKFFTNRSNVSIDKIQWNSWNFLPSKWFHVSSHRITIKFLRISTSNNCLCFKSFSYLFSSHLILAKIAENVHKICKYIKSVFYVFYFCTF